MPALTAFALLLRLACRISGCFLAGALLSTSALWAQEVVILCSYSTIDLDTAPSLAILHDPNAIDIAGIDVTIDLWDTALYGVILRLESPSAVSVVLYDATGSGDGDIMVTFSDLGIPYDSENLDCECLMQPEGPGTLADFATANSEGTWIFDVDETNYSFNSGILNSWCLRIYSSVPLPGVLDLMCAANLLSGQIDVSWTNAADYAAVEIRASEVLVCAIDGPFAAGAAANFTLPLLAAPQVAEISVTPRSSEFVLSVDARCSAPLPATPVDEVELLPAAPLSPDEPAYFAFLEFTSSFEVLDLQVDVEITHPSPYNLEISLLSPAGTAVILHDQHGTPDNIRVTYWELGVPNDDFLDCYCYMQPSGPGSLSDFFGEDMIGTWITVAIVVGSTPVSGTFDRIAIRGYDVGPALPVFGLTCVRGLSSDTVVATWTNQAAYDELRIYVDGSLETTLIGPFIVDEPGTYTTLPVEIPAHVEIGVIGIVGDAPSPRSSCSQSLLLSGAADIQECDNVPHIESNGYEVRLVEVEESLHIQGLEVYVDLLNEPLSHVKAMIRSPAQTSATLFDITSTDLQPFLVMFDDAGIPFDADSVDCACRMAPQAPASLQDFVGELSDGAWILTVTSFTGALLNEWCVRISGCATSPPTDLACFAGDRDVALSWFNGDVYEDIQVLRDDDVIAVIEGSVSEYTDFAAPTGRHFYRLVGNSAIYGCGTESLSCHVAVGFAEICQVDANLLPPLQPIVLEFPGDFTVGEIEVLLQFDNPLLGFHSFHIESPYGTQVTLNSGSYAIGDYQVIWSDAGAPNTGVAGMYECGFCAIQPNGPGSLSDFAGEGAAGSWEFSSGQLSFWTVAEVCVGIREGCPTRPPSGLSCESDGADVNITWTIKDDYSGLSISRDGADLAALAGDQSAYVDESAPVGFHHYGIRADSAGGECFAVSKSCFVGVGFLWSCREDLVMSNVPAVTTETMLILDPIVLAEVEVYFDTDLVSQGSEQLFLMSPYGTAIQLHNETGGVSAFALIWSDDGISWPNSPSYYCCAFDKVRPSGPGSLSDFEGEISDGEWTLAFFDLSKPVSIDRWCLALFPGCGLAPPGELTCALTDAGVSVAWANNDLYESISVLRDGLEIAALDGDTSEYLDENVPSGYFEFQIAGNSGDDGCTSRSPACAIERLMTPACNSDPIDLIPGTAVDVQITVADEVRIRELELALEIDLLPMGFVSDIALESPSGTVITIFDLSFGLRGDFSVIFSDDGQLGGPHTSLDCSGCRIYPSGPGRLSEYESESAEGDWNVAIYSLGVALPGTVESSCLRIYEGCAVAPPSALNCTVKGATVELSWQNAGAYDVVEVTRNELLLETLSGNATEYTDATAPPGRYEYRVIGVVVASDCGARSQGCSVPIERLDACITGGGATSTVWFNEYEEFVIDDLEVVMNFSSPYLDSVDIISVTSPDGTVVILQHLVGTNSDFFYVTYSDHGAPNSRGFGIYDCGGCLLKPSGTGALVDFAGEDPGGAWTIRVDFSVVAIEELCIGVYSSIHNLRFLRGDVNGNGTVDPLADVPFLLNWQFEDGATPPCLDAADVNGDNQLTGLEDALALLAYFFLDGTPPPGAAHCGTDPDADQVVTCEVESSSCN